jgi:PAS domain S-box-containing protein
MGIPFIDSAIVEGAADGWELIGSILASSTQSAIIGQDLDGTIVFWNEGARRLYGYEPEEVVGKADSTLLYTRENVASGVVRAIRETALGAGSWEGTIRGVSRSGRQFTARVVVTPRRDARGRALGFLLIATAISDQIRLTEHSGAIPIATRSLIESNIDAAVTTDPRGIITDVNQPMVTLSGYSRGELIGSPLKTYFTDSERAEAGMRQVLQEGRITDYELVVRARDGRLTVVSYYASVFYQESGQLQGIIAAARDLTACRRGERAVQQYAERLANLRRIDQAILSAYRPRELAEAALRQLHHLIPCRQICIWIFDLQTRTAEVLAAEGSGAPFYAPGAKISLEPLGDSGIAELRSGVDCIVPDVSRLAKPSAILQTFHPSGLGSSVRLPLASEGQLIGSLVLSSDRPGAFDAEQVEMAREVAVPLAIAIRHALLFDEVRCGRQRMQALSRQLLRAQEEERRHIARELHDEIGQSLSAVLINLQRAMRSPDVRSSAPCLKESEGLIELVLDQVRNLSLDLRPSVLDDLGLVASLRWYLGRVTQRAGLVGRLSANPPDIRSGPEIETACFRITQEALTNVVRHARARQVEIRLARRGEHLELIVRDDGVGFDVAAARQRAGHGASLGLLGMQERVALLGGRIAIDAAPGRGTTVQIRLPLSLSQTASLAENEENSPWRPSAC